MSPKSTSPKAAPSSKKAVDPKEAALREFNKVTRKVLALSNRAAKRDQLLLKAIEQVKARFAKREAGVGDLVEKLKARQRELSAVLNA